MNVKRIIAVLMLGGLIVCQAGPLAAQTLYDDFSTGYFKKSMWLDHLGASKYLHEFVREIDSTDEVLVLKYGTNEEIYPSRQGVTLATPFAAPLTGLKADVKIVEMNNDPTDSVTVFGRIAGVFYNRDFASPAADCFDGDIWAELALGDRGNGLEAWFEVEEFDTCANTTAITVDNQSLTTGVTLQTDHFYTLEIVYNGDTELIFRIFDGASLVGSATVNGPVRVGPPHGDNGVLQACVQDDPDEFLDGYVHAEFDNVYVNGAGTAYDTFNGSQINPALWGRSEYVKESINGRARLHVRGQDETKRSRLYLRDQYTPYLEATAWIESGSVVSAGSRGRVRIGGLFYNELYGTGSYNGFEGDALVQVALELSPGGALEARAFVAIANVDHSVWTTRYNGTFPTPILPDSDYVLSINYTGSGFQFGCNGDTLSYTIATAAHAPSHSTRMLDAYLELDSGESGFIKGLFDNVQVTDPEYTNLSGAWAGSVTNHQPIPPSTCAPDDDFTIDVNIAQAGCELILTDNMGSLRSYGVISGSRVLIQFSELDGSDLFESSADMILSDANNMAGERRTKSTPSDCEQTSDIILTRSSVPQYTVTFVAGANGTLSGTTTQVVDEGDGCTAVTAVADSGYRFDQWTGGYTGTDNPLTVTNVTSNMTITANFVPVPQYTVTFVAGANGTLSGTTTQVVDEGDDCTAVTALADSGHLFSQWTGDYTGTGNPLTVTNVTSDMTITANFVAVSQYTVTLVAGANGTLSGTTTQVVDEGDDCTAVTAVADSGYRFDQWTGDYTGTGNPLTVTNVTSDMTINANFVEEDGGGGGGCFVQHLPY